jgi:hypothetical protein
MDKTEEKISPRKLRARKTVKMALEGASYTEIANAVGHKTQKYKRQTVYRSLHQPTAQRLMREISESCEWSAEISLREAVKQYHRLVETKPTIALGYKANADKVAGHLVDRQEVTRAEKVRDLSEVPRDQLQGELLKRLHLSNAGVQTEQTPQIEPE